MDLGCLNMVGNLAKSCKAFLTQYRTLDFINDSFCGLLQGSLVIIICISLASLIFTETLRIYLLNGIYIALITSIILYLVVGIIGSFPLAVSLTQDKPIIILSLVSMGIAHEFTAQHITTSPLSTIWAAIIITGFITGFYLFMMGVFRWGNIIRFVPFPVIGGFLAGTGWLLLLGSFSVMTGKELSIGLLPSLFDSNFISLWIPGTLFGLLLFYLEKKLSYALLIPFMIVLAIIIFYCFLLLSNISINSAGNHGWLLGPFPIGSLWKLPTEINFHSINWHILLEQWGNILSIIILTPIAVLLNASSLELETRFEVDVDKELSSTGIANMLAALFAGGAVGYQAFTLSALNKRLGAKSRLSTIIGALFCMALLLLDIHVIADLPRFVFGGLLVYFSICLLYEWLYESLKSLEKWDYIIILTIFIVIALENFLSGIIAGILVSLVIFVMQYSRIKVIKSRSDGTLLHSNVQRNIDVQKLLLNDGKFIYIIQLQGYLFFGNTHKLLNKATKKIVDTQNPIKYLIISFKDVLGLDSSSVNSFIKLKQRAQDNNITLALTGMTAKIHDFLDKHLHFSSPELFVFNDLDHTLEWAEDIIIHNYEKNHNLDLSWVRQLEQIVPNPSHRKLVTQYFEPLYLPSNTIVFKQDDEAKTLYFLEKGALEVIVENDGKTHRLSTISNGTFFGEIAIYMGGKRTATVQTIAPCTLYCLSKDSLARMHEENPELASKFHRLIAIELSTRLASSNKVIQSLIDY